MKCKLLTIWYTLRYPFDGLFQGLILSGHDYLSTVEIHFKENSIPSIHAGKLTEKSISELEALIAQERKDEVTRLYEANYIEIDISPDMSKYVDNRLKQLTHTVGEKNE